MPNTRYVNGTTSFSGADLQVTFGSRIIGELQQISWGIQREKAPIYTLGSADARSFARGKRGIGGNLVFAQFSRDALLEEMRYIWKEVALPASFTAAGNLVNLHKEDFENQLNLTGWDEAGNGVSDVTTGTEGADGSNVSADDVTAQTDTVSYKKGLDSFSLNGTSADGKSDEINVPHGFRNLGRDNIVYVDMLPPFDITMTFANEYGNAAFQRIYDVDILSDASGLSVDSMVMERQMQFIARRMSPLLEGVFQRSGDDIAPETVYGGTYPKVNVGENRNYTFN